MILKLDKFIVILAVTFLSACASEYPRLTIVDPLPPGINCRIALLPFVYQGDFPRGENIFFKAFAAEMMTSAGFKVIPEGDINQLYKQLKLYRRDLPNEKQMQAIGNRLDAQLIVLGEIIGMTEVDTGSYVDTNITVSVRIHDALTGDVLWSTYHKRKGEEYRNVMHYGRVNTITGLSRRMASEIITKWAEEGMKQCSDRL